MITKCRWSINGPNIAERGEEEGIGDAMAAKIRNAITLYRPLYAAENVEFRLHRTMLYNSIYRADDQLLVNQHTYGIPIPAAQAPVFCLSNTCSGEMASLYLLLAAVRVSVVGVVTPFWWRGFGGGSGSGGWPATTPWHVG